MNYKLFTKIRRLLPFCWHSWIGGMIDVPCEPTEYWCCCEICGLDQDNFDDDNIPKISWYGWKS